MTTKVSLMDAAETLATLVESCDEGGLPDWLREEDMVAAEADVANAIDRRKYVVGECNVRIDAGKKMIKDIKEHLARLEKVRERIKTSTANVLTSHPDREFKDSLGRKVSCRLSSGTVALTIPNQSFTLGNCVGIEDAENPEIAPYIHQNIAFSLDMDRIKQDLQNGKQLSFAHLKKKQSVYGL